MHVPSSDGARIAVHDLGGVGSPLLIAHATGFCGRAYEPLAAELTGRFHVWALDFRGHGDSTLPTAGPDGPLDGAELDWHRMADDLQATVRAISDAPLPVLGHSMGGACALVLEAQCPGTFLWAYVYEPTVVPVGWISDHTERIAGSAARRRASFASRAAALERYAGRPPLNALRADSLLAYVRHGFRDEPDGTVALRCPPDVESRIFAGTGSVTVDDIAAAAIPVTVATGTTAGAPVPAIYGPDQVAVLGHAHLELHPDLGHLGPLEAPATIGAAVLAFAAG